MSGVLIMLVGMSVVALVILILGIRGQRYEQEQRQRAGKP